MAVQVQTDLLNKLLGANRNEDRPDAIVTVSLPCTASIETASLHAATLRLPAMLRLLALPLPSPHAGFPRSSGLQAVFARFLRS